MINETTRQLQNNILDYLGSGTHHDAITGTANYAAADDYMARLNKVQEWIDTIKGGESDYILLDNPQVITDPTRSEIVRVDAPSYSFAVLDEYNQSVPFDYVESTGKINLFVQFNNSDHNDTRHGR